MINKCIKIAATALTTIFLVGGVAPLQAAGTSSVQTMKPLRGVSSQVGRLHGVSYFLSVEGSCKLVLTLAEEPSWDEVIKFTSIRFEASLPAGKSTRYDSAEGNSLEFACLAEAAAMSVTQAHDVVGASMR